MSGDIAAAADVITGALAARVVEPHAGEGGDRSGGGLCLNCGTRLIGAHCHQCGQNGHVHRTVGAIGHELAHGVLHVEGKIFRTLPMLVLHPGALTRRYVGGERARFLSPLALFLFTVFVMYALVSAVGGDLSGTFEPKTMAARAQYNTEIAKAQAELRRIEAAPPNSVDPQDEASRAAALRGTISALELARGTAGGESTQPETTVSTGWEALDHGIAKARENPGLAVYKLQVSAYKYSWLLIIISTPFVALLFLWRRRFGLYDHAIFVTYSIAFMLAMTTVLTLLGAIGLGGGWMTLVALIVPPVHMFAQLRGAYSLGKWSALWRTLVLLVFAFCALAAFIALLLLHGLAE